MRILGNILLVPLKLLLLPVIILMLGLNLIAHIITFVGNVVIGLVLILCIAAVIFEAYKEGFTTIFFINAFTTLLIACASVLVTAVPLIIETLTLKLSEALYFWF